MLLFTSSSTPDFGSGSAAFSVRRLHAKFDLLRLASSLTCEFQVVTDMLLELWDLSVSI